MKDDELRAFLESATVSGEDEENQAEPPAESTIVLPSAPNEQAPTDRVLSFDDLIGQGLDVSGASDARPIVLPGPPDGASSRSRSETGYAGIEATVPIITPSAPEVAASLPKAPPAEPPSELVDTEPFFPPTQAIAASSAGAGGAASAIDASATPAAPTAAASSGSEPVSSTESGAPLGAATPEGVFPSSLSDADYEKISVTGGSSQRRHLMPWIIVAGGAVVALLVAFFIVSSLSGRGSESNEAGTSTQTRDGAETSSSGGSGTTHNTASPTKSPSTSAAPTTPKTNVPSVEVGPTMNMPITHWSTQVDLSQKLGDTYYQITGENLVLTSSLISSLPASCAGQWGMTRSGEGSFTVLKPQGVCAEAPELYDELWGLMDAMVQTARPL